jgi:hypothetical protein
VLDTVMGSFEVGFDELFAQAQVNVQVPHEQFEDRVGVEAGFEPQALDEGGRLDRLAIFYMPDCTLVREQVFVVESQFSMRRFGIRSLRVDVLDSLRLLFEQQECSLDLLFATSHDIRFHHVMKQVDLVSFWQVLSKYLLAEFQRVVELAQTVVHVTQYHSDTAPEITFLSLELHVCQFNLLLSHFRHYRLKQTLRRELVLLQ